ncbi:MAG: carbon storage regulator [Verrucomicrobiales bacterium]|jgi:carbon storage regulator|nr:carbon storage regulator [Verrucomicrobiales bacterium]
MLILSRKLNESIIIDGNIVVKVLRIDKDTVKLGIQAPSELPVHREEIFQAIQKNKQLGINGSHAQRPSGESSVPPKASGSGGTTSDQ